MAISTTTQSTAGSVPKPKLSFAQIWNISFGFLGVQIGYSLQNANTSRILSAIGADPHNLSLFWLAAPLAGLFVQPIVGMSSDKTWTRFGRRMPFIMGGAIVSACAMFFMPNSEHFAEILPPIFFGATMLLLMDTSFNVTMQPFRALVTDMVSEGQRNKGYAIQSFLINTGAVVGSLLPFILTWLGVANEPAPGAKVAPAVIWSFYFGGGALLLTVLWTAFRTKEYPPEEYAKYHNLDAEDKTKVSFITLLKNIPSTMMQLAVTQFFSWFALFLMWVYTTQGIAQNIWNTTDPQSKAFNEAGNWTGVIFAMYSVFAALYSLALTPIANRFAEKTLICYPWFLEVSAWYLPCSLLINIYFFYQCWGWVLPGLQFLPCLMPFFLHHCPRNKRGFIWEYSTLLSPFHKLQQEFWAVLYCPGLAINQLTLSGLPALP